MIKALSLAAAAASLLGGGVAQAHERGEGYLPPAPYAQDGREYRVETREHSDGITLVGADAGVTVLGIHLGGSAKIKLGLDEELRMHHRKIVQRWSGGPGPERREYREYREEGPPPCPEWQERGRW